MFDRVFYVPVNVEDFKLNRGTNAEKSRYKTKSGNQSYTKFDISGFVCDVRVS